MTTKNKFETMSSNAMSNVDETLEEINENDMSSNPYKITQGLHDEGFMFDNDGIYIPFKEKFQVSDEDRRKPNENTYLFITRNPDKKLELKCKWAKKTS